MSVSRAVPFSRAEIGKVWAFLRRDALIDWSYRRGVVGDLLGMLAQGAVFFFLSFLIDPGRMPGVGTARSDYVAFVVVGLTVATFYQTGVSKMMGAVRNEQLMGTLEALLVTPTAHSTLQLGFVIYDLVHIPVRTGLFLVMASVLFGIDLRWAGLIQTAVVIAALLPFIWGVAAGLTAIVVTFRQATGAIALANFALVFASGTYFPVNVLPRWIAVTAELNPLAQALQAARASLIGGGGWGVVASSITVILPVAALAWILGTLAFRLAIERERRAGTLGLY